MRYKETSKDLTECNVLTNVIIDACSGSSVPERVELETD